MADGYINGWSWERVDDPRGPCEDTREYPDDPEADAGEPCPETEDEDEQPDYE